MKRKIEVSSDPSIGSTFRFTMTLKKSNKTSQYKQKLDRRVLLLEPSTTYKNYLTAYLDSIGVYYVACSDIEQIISTLNKQHDAIDAVLLSVTPDDQNTTEARS